MRGRETRRQFLEALGTLAASGCFGGSLMAAGPDDATPVVPFVDEGDFPVGQTVGDGLSRRRALDLGVQFPAPPGPPTFFLRTGAPEPRPPAHEWKVRLHGLVEAPADLDISALRAASGPQGPHLLECARNSRTAHFGFLSIAGWSGIRVSDVLDRVRPKAGASLVLVSGLDQAGGSERGAGTGWIFSRQALQDSGAFLATEMNGVPLSPDHGFPLRLVVPGWYGCAAIKWVNEIAFLGDDAPATAHMQEFAGLAASGLPGPRLAREFGPATIEAAAVATRVQRLSARGAPTYRVTGIAWGGGQPIRALGIRFTPDAAFGRVDAIADGDGSTWRLWSHVFQPPRRGRYRIELAVWEPKLRSRRLDEGHYGRDVVLG